MNFIASADSLAQEPAQERRQSRALAAGPADLAYPTSAISAAHGLRRACGMAEEFV
ncbi:MAG TPA: hypothetical protein VFE13_13770 [Caulobacteraceae bacterium]|nr:hypothetical protein [Caulobacteraceae bacterium]